MCVEDGESSSRAASRVGAEDDFGRTNRFKNILHLPLASRMGGRPAFPAANHRGKVWKPSQGYHVDAPREILDDGTVRIQLKKPWSDGTTSVELEPLAFLARLAALVPARPHRVESEESYCTSSRQAA